MWTKTLFWPVLLWLGLCCGCAPAWHPGGFEGLTLQPGRYLQKYYRGPNLDPTAGVYQVEAFPVEQVSGLGEEHARALFQEELLKALAANGLKVSQEKPRFILSGRVDRLKVASPTWRFLSGRAQAELRVAGEIRLGQEVVFAFQDEVAINPPVTPQHRPTLESDLITRMVVRGFVTHLMNELLLPARGESPGNSPAASLSAP